MRTTDPSRSLRAYTSCTVRAATHGNVVDLSCQSDDPITNSQPDSKNRGTNPRGRPTKTKSRASSINKGRESDSGNRMGGHKPTSKPPVSHQPSAQTPKNNPDYIYIRPPRGTSAYKFSPVTDPTWQLSTTLTRFPLVDQPPTRHTSDMSHVCCGGCVVW